MRNYVTEFIGTFFLVLTVGLTVVGKSPAAPLAIGATLMIMVYMGGHISGGHYNPAVSVAVFLRGKLSPTNLVLYWISQVLGAFAAAWVVHFTLKADFAPAPADSAAPTAAVLIEFLYTFALALVVLNSATSRKTANNSFYGLAIGFTIVVAAYAGGPVSGGAFNPAVGLGPILMDQIHGGSAIANLWMYIVGPILGGAAAALVFRIQNADEFGAGAAS